MSTIVVLNGIGSSGKSAIARALQAITREVFLHVGMDAFLEMMPAASFGRADGLSFEPGEKDGHRVLLVRSGPAQQRALRGMRRAVAAMAAEGNNIILDEVMLGAEWADYSVLLANFRVRTVGVFAPLDVLEAREAARGDRAIGLARGQWGQVHTGMEYDLEVDTSRATPEECAELIRQRFGL